MFLVGLFLAVASIFVVSVASRKAHADEASFTDNGNGTVTDTKKGLVWQKEDEGTERDWKDAAAYCKGLKLAGHSDWRLPDKKELVSLWYGAGSKEDMKEKFFPGMKSSFYWTSMATSTSENYAKNVGLYAWSLNFADGRASNDKQEGTNIVRCVRNN